MKLEMTTAKNSFKYGWLLSRIMPYITPYWFRITLGFLVAIPLGLLDGVTAFALKPYMDYVVGGKALEFTFLNNEITITSIQMAFILPFAVILFAVIQGVLRYLNGYLSSWTSAHITNDVKFDLFKRLVHMHPQFFDENSSGIIISRYMGDPGAASAGIVDNIKTITTSLFGALGLIAVMLYSSWKLAIIGVLVLCIAFLPVALIRKRIKEASNRSMVIGGNITTNINETYNGNKVMAAYGLQDKMYDYFEKQTWDGYNVGMSLYKRSGWMSPMMYLIASFGIAIVLGFGTYLINSGQMTAGSFASFVTSLLLLYKPVKTLGKRNFGKNGLTTKYELLGHSIIPIVNNPPPPKSICDTQSFPEFTSDFDYIKNELQVHIHSACRRLRQAKCKCNTIGVIVKTKDFKCGFLEAKLENPTDFELNISKTAFELLEMMYSPNILYRSVGILLEEFKTCSNEQLNMFEDQVKKEKSERLGKAIDRIEEKFGRNKIKVGFTNKDVPNKQGFMTSPTMIY